MSVAIVLMFVGVYALPLGYFLGFNTSDYATAIKLLIGAAGIASGIGMLRRREWADWLGLALLLTQIVTVILPGFRYETLFSIGFWFDSTSNGQPMRVKFNVLALLAILGILSRWIPQSRRASPP